MLRRLHNIVRRISNRVFVTTDRPQYSPKPFTPQGLVVWAIRACCLMTLKSYRIWRTNILWWFPSSFPLSLLNPNITLYIYPNILLESTNVVHDFLHPLSALELPQGLRAQDRHLRQRRQPQQRHQLPHRHLPRHHLRRHLSSRSSWDCYRMTSAIAATSRCSNSIQSCLSLRLQAAQVWHVPSAAWQVLAKSFRMVRTGAGLREI